MEANLSTYVAPVACVNCGYEGDLELPVGDDIFSGTCPCCVCSGRLRPNNDHYHYEKANRGLFG
jgi:hypothetical protein